MTSGTRNALSPYQPKSAQSKSARFSRLLVPARTPRVLAPIATFSSGSPAPSNGSSVGRDRTRAPESIIAARTSPTPTLRLRPLALLTRTRHSPPPQYAPQQPQKYASPYGVHAPPRMIQPLIPSSGGTDSSNPSAELPTIHTNDAATKLSDRVRRGCFNCCTTDTSTWRSSNLSPGKAVCRMLLRPSSHSLRYFATSFLLSSLPHHPTTSFLGYASFLLLRHTIAATPLFLYKKCALVAPQSRPSPEQFPHKRGPRKRRRSGSDSSRVTFWSAGPPVSLPSAGYIAVLRLACYSPSSIVFVLRAPPAAPFPRRAFFLSPRGVFPIAPPFRNFFFCAFSGD
ncbi:hypothetical protein B0H16DRAFT_1714478 [Mycena metata]|uniref:Uncharacterized protein n=1 Tax=Mycena metata TaxID=1033252 RepID=A0AAD7JV47_9AGAR|nr:hypothetical protein B0H16DRAFT_1714478 [Mycena metata]